MSLVNFSRSATVSVAFVCTLTACGGGGGGDSADNSNNNAAGSNITASADVINSTPLESSVARLETEASVSNIATETVTVSLVGAGPQISTSPVLKLTNGSPVTRLEDIPEGIATSEWKTKTGTRLPLKVLLKNGTYRLSNTWVWTPAASGRADSPVIVAAETAGGVIITGAKTLTLPKASHAGQSTVQVDVANLVTTPFEQLWANGRRVVRARTPNAGSFALVKGSVASWAGSTTLNQIAVNKQAFQSENAVASNWKSASATDRANAILVAMHSWTTSHHRVSSFDAANQVLVSPASRWAFFSQGPDQRYFIENLPTALDAPSEWYLNATTKRLSYIPTAAESTADITFDMPVVNTLLELRGQASAGQWVEYVQFSGLKFRHAGYAMPAQGLVDQQAAVDVTAAITMNSARRVSLTDCEVSRVGGYAVWLRENVQNTVVQNCEIYDTGAGGVRVGLTLQPLSTAATGYNSVLSNRIHSTGHQFPGAVGVWVGQSGNNAIEGNLIGDTTYTGISVGWTWGYGISQSRNNKVNRNFLYDIMQGSLSDGAGIYTLGISPGTEIKGNVIRGVQAYNYYGAGGWGIYGDEGSSNLLIDSNIVLNSNNGGYMLHYGANNIVSNNVFAGGRVGEIQVGRIETEQQAELDNNRLIPTVPSFVAYPVTGGVPAFAYKSNRVSTQYTAMSTPPSVCGSGCSLTNALSIEAGNKLQVPTVTEAGNTVSLPYASAPSWASVGVTPADSPARLWSKGRGVSFDAAEASLGSRPMGFTVVPASRPELIAVANVGGDRCLAFNDSADVQNRWEPFGYLESDYATGTTSITFTLKIDATTDFMHEWRDTGVKNYLTGPAMTFSGTRGVVLNGQVVAPLPVGQWVTVTVTSPQGTSPRWTLSIKYADNTERTFTNLVPVSETWARTRAFYFISNAARSSTPCIGKWDITNL